MRCMWCFFFDGIKELGKWKNSATAFAHCTGGLDLRACGIPASVLAWFATGLAGIFPGFRCNFLCFFADIKTRSITNSVIGYINSGIMQIVRITSCSRKQAEKSIRSPLECPGVPLLFHLLSHPFETCLGVRLQNRWKLFFQNSRQNQYSLRLKTMDDFGVLAF